MFTNLDPGSCDLDRLNGFAILSLRNPLDPLTLEADRPSPVPVPILTIDTPSSTNVSSRLLLLLLLLLLGLLGLSWRFVGWLVGVRRRAAGCAGEPPKLSLAATAALESSCSLAAAVDDPTTPGCSFRVFGGRMGGGVGFAGPLPENMSHISQNMIGQKINNYWELFHFVSASLSAL